MKQLFMSRLFSPNRVISALAWARLLWSVWIDGHWRITWIECDHVRISRTGWLFGRWKMDNGQRDFYSWPNKRGVIEWFLEAAKRGTDMPHFPDRSVLKTVAEAIERGGISIPKKQKEKVAAALLKLKLDWAEKGK